METYGSQEVTLFPMVEACSFVSLQAAGGLAAEPFGIVAAEYSMQQRGQQSSDLGDGDRRRVFFSPAAFPA